VIDSTELQMEVRALQFLAIVLTALALIPAGAHFFELANKIELDRHAYFTVQQIYAGWWLFGIAQISALLGDAALTVMLRDERPAFYLALTGMLALVANLAVFFTWTFPTNQATANWTEVPQHWEALRRQWEYSHAFNAVIMFTSFCAITLAALCAASKGRTDR
jgi:hypothetical protein